MELMVRDLLRINELTGIELIAGKPGESRLIKSVSVLENPHSVESWITGNELVLSTLYNLNGKFQLLEDLVRVFHDNNVACLAVHPGTELPTAELERLIECSDKLDFPLLKLPPDMSYVTVINSVLTRMVNYQFYLLERSHDISNRFTRILLNGGRLQSICDTLSDILQLPVMVLDKNQEQLQVSTRFKEFFHNSARQSELLAIKREIEQSRYHHNQKQLVPGAPKKIDPFDVYYEPVIASRECFGYVLVWDVNRTMSDIDFVAIQHSVTTCALEMVKQKAVMLKREMQEKDFIEELLTNQDLDEHACIERSHQFNLPVQTSAGVCTLEVKPGLKNKYNVTSSLLDIIKEHVKEYKQIRLYAIKDKFVLLYFDRMDERVLQEIFVKISKQIDERFSLQTVCGIGTAKERLFQASESYSEAMQAIAIGSKLKKQVVYTYSQLGLYNLLYLLSEREKQPLQLFCESELGPVIQHDRQFESNLIETLEIYLQEKESYKATAERLYVHPNTVKYRIDKIKDLLGEAAFKGENRFQLELALKGLKFLNVDGEASP